MSAERGDIVLGWLSKIAIIVAIVGVVGYDSVAIAVGHVSAADTASAAVLAASDTWKGHPDLQLAYDAAAASAAGSGDTIDPKTFTVAPDGTVHLEVHHKATTLVLYRISPLAHYADVTATASGRDVTS